MSRTPIGAGSLLAVFLCGAAPAAAQDIHITPSLGAYHAGQNLNDMRRAAADDRLTQNVPIAFGLALEASIVRISAAYASGATIQGDGPAAGALGKGSLFAGAADLVFRPIPRLLFIQPYVLGGIGYKRVRYSFDDDGLSGEHAGHAWHLGVGADLMFGNLGVVAEITDFIDRDDDLLVRGHDSFAMIGLRFRVR